MATNEELEKRIETLEKEVKHLEPNNIVYPLKFTQAKLIENCYISLMLFPPPQVIFGLLLLSIAVVLIWDIRYNPFGEDEDGI